MSHCVVALDTGNDITGVVVATVESLSDPPVQIKHIVCIESMISNAKKEPKDAKGVKQAKVDEFIDNLNKLVDPLIAGFAPEQVHILYENNLFDNWVAIELNKKLDLKYKEMGYHVMYMQPAEKTTSKGTGIKVGKDLSERTAKDFMSETEANSRFLDQFNALNRRHDVAYAMTMLVFAVSTPRRRNQLLCRETLGSPLGAKFAFWSRKGSAGGSSSCVTKKGKRS
jgi:hypothetical protein